MEFGDHLKEWRGHRRMSQLELATEAGISARHLSFLETGRSRPSEGMILRLSAVLDIPARDQGMLFTAAGFRPRFATSPAASLAAFPPAVAEAIGLGERTLRRQLARSGWTVRDLVEDTMCEMATTMLVDYALPADEEQVWSVWKGNARVQR